MKLCALPPRRQPIVCTAAVKTYSTGQRVSPLREISYVTNRSTGIAFTFAGATICQRCAEQLQFAVTLIGYYPAPAAVKASCDKAETNRMLARSGGSDQPQGSSPRFCNYLETRYPVT
jgi:hypothetical protein